MSLPIRLHRAQHDFRCSTAMYRGFVGGIGSGKSWVGAYDLAVRARPGRLYMATAPTYPMMRDATLRYFLGIARDHLGLVSEFKRSEMAVVFSNDAEVLFRSADDPDRLRGPNLSGCWIDEASLCKREVYDVLIGRLRECGESGWLSATFTPKGRSHWTCEVFGKGAANTALVHAPTRHNPFLPEGFEAQLREQYAGLLADQELEGLFVDVAGAEWPGTYFPAWSWFDDWPKTGVVTRVLALDPSKGKSDRTGDYSAYVRADLTTDGHVWIDADLRRRPSTQIVRDGLDHYWAFDPSAIVVETNQFQELLIHDFARVAREHNVRLPLYGIVNSEPKVVRIRRIGPYLARGELRFRAQSPGAEMLVDQLRAFPEGEHDDGPDALEMALRMLAHLVGRRSAVSQPEILRT